MFARVLVLLLLPFMSTTVIAHSTWLRKLATTHNWITWPLGVAGLGCLTAGLVGVLSGRYALPLTILGGAVSGFSVFSVRRTDDNDDGDDWRRRPPSPDIPPPQPAGEGPIDWERFDRLRGAWERRAVHGAKR
jgi:hypothetical protein